ncbi:MAG TPA: sulfotransferase [Pirellulales bacterium]
MHSVETAVSGSQWAAAWVGVNSMRSNEFTTTETVSDGINQRTIALGNGLPNLFVVGSAKAGTTALYHYFKLHPQIFVPDSVKETNYMSFYSGMPALNGPRDKIRSASKSITDFIEYQRLYSARCDELIAADVSPSYLYYPQAAEKIAQVCPGAKIVIILRNPIECSFSMYAMMRNDGRESCRYFRDAFGRSAQRIAAGWEWGWDYQGYPKYWQAVARYQRLFPASQLFIRRYADLKERPENFYRELNDFLGTDSIDLAYANRRVNTAPRRGDLLRRWKLGRWCLRAARIAGLLCPSTVKTTLRRRLLDPPAFTLTTADRLMLIDHFGPDILELTRCLSLDLSGWLRSSS